jgi:hypothetical protein
MARERNYKIGYQAQDRIKKILQELPNAVVETGPQNGYPDLVLRCNGVIYGVECKSILGVHSGGRMGVAKFSSTEVYGMQALRQENHIPCVIVEIRPRCRSEKVYLFIPWERVFNLYSVKQPGQMSLNFWWILKNSVPLNHWISQVQDGGAS